MSPGWVSTERRLRRLRARHERCAQSGHNPVEGAPVSVSQTFALRADPRDLLRFGEQTAVAAFQFNSLLQGVVRGY